MGILRVGCPSLLLLVMWWAFRSPLPLARVGLSKPRNDCFAWTAFMNKFYKVKLFRVGDESATGTALAWICNHRDWDFFIDLHVVEGRSCFLSRLTGVAFPLFGFYGLITRNAVFFRRNALRDFAKFNQWVTQQIQQPLPRHCRILKEQETLSLSPFL